MLRYFDQCIACKVHSIHVYPINVCIYGEINWYKSDKFRKHAKIGTSWGLGTSDRYFNQEHSENQPEYPATSGS